METLTGTTISIVALVELIAAILLIYSGVLVRTGRGYKDLFEAAEKRSEYLEKELHEARTKFDSHTKESSHIEAEYRILKKENATLNSFLAKDRITIEELEHKLARYEQRDRGDRGDEQ